PGAYATHCRNDIFALATAHMAKTERDPPPTSAPPCPHLRGPTGRMRGRKRRSVTPKTFRLHSPRPGRSYDLRVPGKVTLAEKLAISDERWTPKIVARFNDNDVRIVQVQ